MTNNAPAAANDRNVRRSRLQRPASLYGKPPGDPSKPPSLKPLGAVSKDATSASPTRLPVAGIATRSGIPSRVTQLPNYSSGSKRPASVHIIPSQLPEARSRSPPEPAVEVEDGARHTRQSSRLSTLARVNDKSVKTLDTTHPGTTGDGNRHITKVLEKADDAKQRPTGSNTDPCLAQTVSSRRRNESRTTPEMVIGAREVSGSSAASRKTSVSSVDTGAKQRILRRTDPASSIGKGQPTLRTTRSTAQRATGINTQAAHKEPTATVLSKDGKKALTPVDAPALRRPAFSTLQQHYSPKKTSAKPLTSAITNPNPPPANDASLSVIRLQTELLQLSLLHEASLEASSSFEASAHVKLGQRFAAISAKHQSLRVSERTIQERLNLLALRDWTSGSTTLGLAENVQLLSRLVKELPQLVDAGGRFDRLASEFSLWVASVEDINTARGHGGDGVFEARILEGLGSTWHAENLSLTRRLTALAQDAELLVDVKEGSSVAAVVSGCKACVKGTLEELMIMKKIEADIMMAEKIWVNQQLDNLSFQDFMK